ncbi:MAG: hypothetical protein ABIP53_04600 [Candidatus Limnocylindrales bacterium]
MENPPASPNTARGLAFGIAAAIPVALVYGILADPFGLSWGLIIVGLLGGWIIGSAVAQGAWSGRFHLIVPAVRWLAALVAVVTWIGAAAVAYFASQLFYQAATTPIGERLSLGGFVEYLNGTVFGPSILGLAAMAFVAWRAAR